MYPKIWIFDSYALMIFIGIILCFLFFYWFSKRLGYSIDYLLSVLILAILSIIIGFGFAVLVQWILDLLKGLDRELAMTFYGGLIGGVLTFILGWCLVIKKKHPEASFIEILEIAPACIMIAHGFGRIGCFLDGCCYGIRSRAWYSVRFPGMRYNVIPTQLFEAVFLITMALALLILALYTEFKYEMSIYLISYGVFRFLIEFLRGDERGYFLLKLSPAQWFSILAFITGIALIFIIKKVSSRPRI